MIGAVSSQCFAAAGSFFTLRIFEQNGSTMHSQRLTPTVLLATAALALTACGGGDSSSSAASATKPDLSLQGLAATGAALPNALVTAKCATGAPVTGTTANDGSFSLTLNGGQTTPCMLQVTGANPTVTLHGFAVEAGRVNLTSLTDLVVTRALGTDPAARFAGFTSATGDTIRAALDAAKSYVTTQLTALTGSTTATDIMTGVFKVGDADDKLLDNLGAIVKLAGKSMADLRMSAAQGSALKALVQATTPPSTTPPATTTPPVVTAPGTTTPPVVIAPGTTTPPVLTPPLASYECAPLLPKAGDSLTYRYSTTPAAVAYDSRYDYSATTYQGQNALALTVTSTINGITGTSVSYTNPATGAYLGATAPAATTNTVTTYDPPDFQDRINNAVYNVGQIATVAVKARITGKGITDAFAAIGGGTAMALDYTYTVERKPNESLSVAAGSFANVCKLQINVTVTNLKLEGNDGSNALFSTFFPTLSAAFSQPFKSTVWLTNKLPLFAKSFVDTTSSFAAVSATQELKTYTLAPR